jgi:hypothetical protein
MRTLILFFSLALSAGALAAQNSEAAVGGIPRLSAGVEYSNFNPDYGCPSNVVFHCGNDGNGGLLSGIGAFVDFNVRPKWGAEGEARWLDFHGVGGEKEANYLVGGRYRFVQFGKADVWGKMLIGDGSFTGPKGVGLSENRLAYVPGVTLDYRLTQHLSFRADYEYQIWPSFVGNATSTGEHNHGLTPNGVSIGFSWSFGKK